MMNMVASAMNTGRFNDTIHIYCNTGKNVVYPLLLDVTSDIIRQLNRRIVIPLLPVEKYPGGNRPDRMIPLIRLTDGKE